MFFKKATTGRNDLIWYIMGLLTVFVGVVIGSVPLFLVKYYRMQADQSLGTEELDKFNETMDFTILNIDKNLGFAVMLASFVFAFVALMLAVRHYHQRPFKFLITPRKKINYSKILFGFGFWFVLAILFEIFLYYRDPTSYEYIFSPGKWGILMLLCIFVLPIQTTFEELLLRGYLMPAVSLISKNKWIPLLATSVFFGLIHFDNPEIDKYGFGTMQIYYIGAGLFLGLITILDDSLELAIGVHAATNLFGAAFVTMEGSVLQTDSILRSAPSNPYLMMLVFFLSAIIFMFVCNKKYKWSGFKRLFDPIGKSYENPNQNEESFIKV